MSLTCSRKKQAFRMRVLEFLPKVLNPALLLKMETLKVGTSPKSRSKTMGPLMNS